MAGGVCLPLKGEHSSLFHAKQEVVSRMAYSHCRRYAFPRKPQYLLLKGNTGMLPFFSIPSRGYQTMFLSC